MPLINNKYVIFSLSNIFFGKKVEGYNYVIIDGFAFRRTSKTCTLVEYFLNTSLNTIAVTINGFLICNYYFANIKRTKYKMILRRND